MKRRLASLLTCTALAVTLGVAAARPAAAVDGVIFDGRWIDQGRSHTASYPGSRVRLVFTGSTRVTADLTVAKSNGGPIFISVVTDNAAPVRMQLNAGTSHVVLASNLSRVRVNPNPAWVPPVLIQHEVIIIKENEASFGSLQFANPVLDSGGSWVPISDNRPVVEAIGDSNSNGLCILGPVNPPGVVDTNNARWQQESLAWPALLETLVRRIANREIDVVNLTYSGTRTLDQAAKYQLTAPDASPQTFTVYPANRTVQLAILFGGVLDSNGGGDPATGSPVTVKNLSPFQQGVFSLISQILARNPQARVALPWYSDPYGPSWQLALSQVRGLFPPWQQANIFIYPLVDKQYFNACLLSPDGHPSSQLHEVWAGELFNYMTRDGIIP